ncbi:hypothetical protein VF14_09005 [Nostoc linckia z18]|uniref:Uncharacterized protein n=2 Tax=Nostoc linckia TaxID=92942 RepID=A0A9Q5ZEL6_NOSLI|nr:hypothetical protein [Nostoc linckia]PHK32499.1 hypothetical protein VF12_26625 [Nostoc linckia z15]PHK44555.1 hypothetical protein VF13_21355 [Nostoc linckia z16]PHJ59599.1 hypothetical protein VF02_24630 [Nostoc linckia z1]PHJ65123.1 hypothetical protein VF05_21520 [Nostoc linckia z3]PHJ69604.1 hypothetical protein VF03_23710 [Nostoc linckia z2]
MASSLVDLIIRARDGASDIFDRIRRRLGLLGRDGGDAGGNIGDALFGAILKANLLGQALNAVGNAAQFMGQKFEEAKKIQLDTVSAAGTFAALTGESYKESEKFVTSFGAELSKIAGALPGATADYQKVANSIMDNVIPAFKDANGVLNKGEFQKNLTDITKQMTLLGISSGTDAGAVGMFTARLLDGNIASARNLLFADNNPAFINLLEQEMKKRGKVLNDMKNLSSKERIEVVKAVSGKLITKDVIDAASNTVDGLIAGIQSSLFDPTSGVFGLLRDLSVGEGQQNIMTAVAGGIKAVQAFFDAGASILQALGVPSVDPMLALYNGINTFTGWVKKASDFATSLAKLAKGGGGGIGGVSAIFNKIFDPDFLLGGLQKLTNSIQGFIKPDILVNAFQGFMGGAQKLFNPTAILNGFEKFLGGINAWIGQFFSWLATSSGKIFSGGGGAIGFGLMGAKLGVFGGLLVGKLIQFIINLPWGDILISIGNIALAAIPFIVGLVASFRATVLVEIGRGLLSIGGKLLEGLNNIWLATSYTISEWLNSYISGWGEVGSFAVSSIQNWLANFANGWTEVVNSAIASAQNFFASLGQAIADMWNQLLSAITGSIGNVIGQAQSTIAAPVSAIGNVVSDPIGTATSVVTNAGQSAFNLGQNIASGVGNLLGFYKGHIPTAAGGLLGAFANESRNMPSGASPVVANSSEFILTPAQMQRMMQGSAAVGASTRNTVFSPVINVYGVNDPVAIARLALEQLELMYAQQQQGVLA